MKFDRQMQKAYFYAGMGHNEHPRKNKAAAELKKIKVCYRNHNFQSNIVKFYQQMQYNVFYWKTAKNFDFLKSKIAVAILKIEYQL